MSDDATGLVGDLPAPRRHAIVLPNAERAPQEVDRLVSVMDDDVGDNRVNDRWHTAERYFERFIC